MKKALIIALVLSLEVINLTAQDEHFTQFYAAPTHLNPAFAGTSIQSRFGMNYRNQWPAIAKAFVTYHSYYDQYLPKMNSGIGFSLLHDRAGDGALSNTGASFQYAYELRLNRLFSLRPALQMSYLRRALNIDRLTFTDQLMRGGAETSVEALGYGSKGVLDVSAGALLYSEKYWLGVSQHHLNQPNIAVTTGESKIPVKLSFHGGARFRVQNPRYRSSRKDFLVAFNYKQQAEFSQLDIGSYIELKPLVFGIWYRGLPFKDNGYAYANREGLNLIFGYHHRNYKFGYSVDVNLGQLNISNSAGAHEISLIYEWANKKNKRLSKRRIIPCAKF